MKKFIRVALIVLSIIVLLLILLVEKIDRTPYQDTEHYAAWKEWIAQKSFVETEGTIQTGWAKENITPEKPGPLSGHGKRWGKHFEQIHDSLYVRVVAVRNPNVTVYLLSADMLIIPPNIRDKLAVLLQKEGISIANVHLGATHTHHGLGGWGQKLAGFLFSGKYDKEVEDRLALIFRNAILRASAHMVDTDISYVQNKDGEDIRNRLNITDGIVDPWIRSLIFERADGTRAELVTYGAHATVLNAKFLQISRDFPGALVDSLEREKVDFAMYMAGAVGSMGADAQGETPLDRVGDMASGMLKHLGDSAAVPLAKTMVSDYFEIPMPPPSVRIGMDYALRPWVFKTFFGDQSRYLKVTKIGKTLLLGMPADFSGEIMSELDVYADERGIELIVTSFNGGYIGYITHDRLYERDLYETMIMSWNGYQAGGYLGQVTKDIVDKLK